MTIITVGDLKFEVEDTVLQQSEYYAGLISSYDKGEIPALILNNDRETAVNYIEYLLRNKKCQLSLYINPNFRLEDNLNYCFYIGDPEYLKLYVDEILEEYTKNKFLIKNLNSDLQRDIYLHFPLPLVPYELRENKSFLTSWLRGKNNNYRFSVDHWESYNYTITYKKDKLQKLHCKYTRYNDKEYSHLITYWSNGNKESENYSCEITTKGTYHDPSYLRDTIVNYEKRWTVNGTIIVDNNSIETRADDELRYNIYVVRRDWTTKGEPASNILIVNHTFHDGVYRAQWYSQTIASEINYTDGDKHGLCRYWHKNGNIREECNYNMGKMHGPFIHYDRFGRKTCQSQSYDDKISGDYISWRYIEDQPVIFYHAIYENDVPVNTIYRHPEYDSEDDSEDESEWSSDDSDITDDSDSNSDTD